MRLSVVVCTLGRPERLAGLLAEVVDQVPVEAEVVVVDQSDGWAAVQGERAAAPFEKVRWIAHHPKGLPGARNRGIRETSGALVWFIDDDVHLQPGCVQALLGAFADPTVGGVVGRIHEKRLAANARGIRNEVGRDGRIRTNLDVDGCGVIASLKGANMAFRRQALEQAGPFDLGYRGTSLLEDADMSERVRQLGWTLLYEARAAVVHDHDPVGGVRQSTEQAAFRSRFANTGFFVGRHRPVRHLPLVLATHVALAARGAVRWRTITPAADWIRAFGQGWRDGRQRDRPRW